MRAGWVILCGVVGLALAGAGCRRHVPVDLEPAKEAETLNVPPHEERYDKNKYPKEAFKSDDAQRKLRDPDASNPIVPVKGPMGPGGGPAMMPGGRPSY